MKAGQGAERLLYAVIPDVDVARSILEPLGLPARPPPRGRARRKGPLPLPLPARLADFDGIDPPSAE